MPVYSFVETPKLGQLSDMQFFYDSCLPGNSFVLNEYDAWSINTTDFTVNSEPVILDMSKRHVNKGVQDAQYLRPLLHTAVEPPRRPGLLENLLALIKRNFNAPDLAGQLDYDYLSRCTADNFFKKLAAPDVEVHELLNLNSLYVVSEENLSEWIGKQEPTTIAQMASWDYIGMPAVDQYRHMIKRKPKAKLDLEIQCSYPALQTIVYHSKHVNAVFGPIFSALTEKLLSIIDPLKFKFYTRTTPLDLQDFFSTIPGGDLEILELDISKYDKSQNRFHFEVEMRIWEILGLDAYLRKVWENGHRKTHLKDYIAGIKTVIEYQRKSGDVTTFIGNTIIIAACLCSILPVDLVSKAAFCGDDSIIYMPKGIVYPDIESATKLQWNFEAKLFKKIHGYFCGSYILRKGTNVRLVPDPLKIITKLGAKDIKDWDHLEEVRESLFDICKGYSNCSMIDVLDEAVKENYPNACGLFVAYCSIYKYLSNKVLFRSLFVCENGKFTKSRKNT